MNKTMKKILALLMVLAMALSMFTACGAKEAVEIAGTVIDILAEDDASDVQDDKTEADQAQDAEDEQIAVENGDGVDEAENADNSNYVDYYFRNDKLLTQHYEKHGIEMNFDSKESYEKAASDVVNNPKALHKTEKEDGDDIYYVEDTNEFVVVSGDGYIRTYFLPSAGKKYYDKQ